MHGRGARGGAAIPFVEFTESAAAPLEEDSIGRGRDFHPSATPVRFPW